MIIELKKFGNTLISRQAGREALAAFQPTLQDISATETIEIDFDGVLTFSPSWADEFLTPLRNEFGSLVILHETSNHSVRVSLEILDENR